VVAETELPGVRVRQLHRPKEPIMKILGVTLAVLVGCRTVQVPPCSVPNAWGIARAATPESAQRLSASVEHVAPQVAAAVPGLWRRPLDVRLLPTVNSYMHFSLGGACVETPSAMWIEIGAGDDQESEDAVLAHEIVHGWLGPDWSPLPPALEDGLADMVEESVAPEKFTRTRMAFVIAMSTILTGDFAIDSYGAPVGKRNVPFSLRIGVGPGRGGVPRVREILATNVDAYETESDQLRFFGMVAFGYFCAQRIGVERLHDLCLRAKWEGHALLPPDWIIEAAGLAGADIARWNDAVLEMYGILEQRELIRNPPWLPTVERHLRTQFTAKNVPLR
jgi:hypothetical protein